MLMLISFSFPHRRVSRYSPPCLSIQVDPTPERVDVVDKIKTSLMKCGGRRWSEATWLNAPRKTLSQVINDEASFNFRPYSFTLRGVMPDPYFARSSGTIMLQLRSAIHVDLQYFLGVLVPTLLPSRLEGGDAIVAYSPQRIIR